MKNSYYLSKLFLLKVLILLVCVAFSVVLTYAFVFPEYSYVMNVISPLSLSAILVLIVAWEIRLSARSKEAFAFGFAYHTLCAISVFVLACVKDVIGGYTIDDGFIMFAGNKVEAWEWLMPYLVYCIRLGIQSIPLEKIRLWMD